MEFIRDWLYENRIVMLWAFVFGLAWIFLHATAVAGSQDGEARHVNQVLRLHILAHDDTAQEQALKLAVRDGIWAYMYDVGNRAASLDEAREIVAENLPYIEAAAARIVQAYGDVNHEVTVQLAQNQAFPAMSYAGIIFPQGRYESLQITIGAGNGSNWWCVMFPAMCLMEITQAEVIDSPPATTQEIIVRPRFRLAEAFQGVFN